MSSTVTILYSTRLFAVLVPGLASDIEDIAPRTVSGTAFESHDTCHAMLCAAYGRRLGTRTVLYLALFWPLHASIHQLCIAWGRKLAGFGAIVLGGYVEPPNLPQGVRWMSVQHLFARAELDAFVAAGWPMPLIADYVRLVIVFFF